MVNSMDTNLYEEIFNRCYGYKLEDLEESDASQIRNCIVELRKSYKNDMPITEYSDENIRKAYMLAYYPNYIIPAYNLMKTIIIPSLKKFNVKSRLKIRFFAAGPGAEVYGTLKALEEVEYDKRLDVAMLDYENGWINQRNITSEIIKNLNLKVSSLHHTLGCDLRKDCKENCTNWTSCENSVFQGDIYFMQNCINHMEVNSPFESAIVERIKLLKSGACFVIIDLDYLNVKKILKNILYKTNKFASIVCTNIDKEPEKCRINFQMPENMKKYIFDSSDNLIPKKNTKYYYMILTKN